MFRKADVFVGDSFAGVLSEVEEGYSFVYDEEYMSSSSLPVSLTMPFEGNPFFSRTLFPFFDGLIPEGWLLRIVEENWKIPHSDRFGVLLVACKDCVGAVSVVERKE